MTRSSTSPTGARGSETSPGDVRGIDTPVLHLQNIEGLLTWPYEEIAMLRTERCGRVEATSMRGEVAHRPGPLADWARPPLVEALPGVFVHPRHARVRGGRLVLPGGWSLPFEGRLPRPAPLPPPEPIIPSIGVRPDEVLYLKLKGRGAWYWMTDRGRIPAAHGVGRDIASLHPHLMDVSGVFVNPRRIRAILPGDLVRLVLDEGTRIAVDRHKMAEMLSGLGVPDLRYLQRLVPEQQGLYMLGIRDWPRLVRDAGAAWLKATFGADERMLVANVIWESCRLRAEGVPTGDGTDHRGYWYNPLRPILQHYGAPLRTLSAGEGDAELMGAVIPPGTPDKERGAPRRRRTTTRGSHYAYFTLIIGEMVGAFRLLTYQELGFVDKRPDLRVIGKERPEVVLLVEKATVEHFAFELARRFGCSLLIAGGFSNLLDTEYFVQALREAHAGAVRIAAYVDYDPPGWYVAAGFRDQLARYGVETKDIRHLVRPERFTAHELEILSYPLKARSAAMQTDIDLWLKASGGIDGRATGISSDCLRPVERLAAAFEEETGLRPLT